MTQTRHDVFIMWGSKWGRDSLLSRAWYLLSVWNQCLKKSLKPFCAHVLRTLQKSYLGQRRGILCCLRWYPQGGGQILGRPCFFYIKPKMGYFLEDLTMKNNSHPKCSAGGIFFYVSSPGPLRAGIFPSLKRLRGTVL